MIGSKKAVLATVGIIISLALVFVGLCFLFPDMLGLGKQDESGSEAIVGKALSDSQTGGKENAEIEPEEDPAAIASSEAAEEASREASVEAERQEASRASEAASIAAAEKASIEASIEASIAASEEAASEEAAKASSEAAAKASSEAAAKASSEAAKASSEAAAKASSEAVSSKSGGAGTGSPEGMVDKSAPVFLSLNSTPSVKVGSTFNVHNYIGYADDVDRDLELEVSGTVDTSKVGTYKVKVTIKDDAGHSTSKTLEVKVVESSSSGGSGGSSGKKEAFSDFIKNYKTDETMLGIDVSRWQESIDWAKCKAAGCEFAYMRLGGYDNGELYTDKYFKANIAGAKAAGMKIGIYWHAEESTEEEIKASVAYLVDVLGGEALDFPIAYDWEDYKNFENYGMNLQDLNMLLKYFERELEANGYSVCLYGSKNFQENVWTIEKNSPIWLAHYTSATSYTGNYFMWQHSCTGKIDGINGDVDLDVFYPAKLK